MSPKSIPGAVKGAVALQKRNRSRWCVHRKCFGACCQKSFKS